MAVFTRLSTHDRYLLIRYLNATRSCHYFDRFIFNLENDFVIIPASVIVYIFLILIIAYH